MKTKIISFNLLLLLIASPTKSQEWEFVGLDSMVIRQLYVFGDTIYAGTAVRNGFNINAGLYLSTNNGSSWMQLDSALGSGAIMGLEFSNVDKNTFFVIKGISPATLGGNLFKTTNSGLSWELITQLEDLGLNWVRISPFNNNEIYARESHGIPAGWYATVYRSLDGGANWQEITYLPSSSHGRNLTFNLSLNDSNKLYAAVDDRFGGKYFYVSTNKGDSWNYISEPPFVSGDLINDSQIPDRIYLSAWYLSDDGGYIWELSDSGLPDTSYYRSFYEDQNNNEIYTLRSDGLYISDKENIYWNRIEGSEILPLANGIGGFTSSDIGLMKNIIIEKVLNKIYVGTGYGIYKRDYVSDVNNSQLQGVNKFTLEQNYPNPFNPATIIKYKIPERSIITIKVYDILGNEISTLIEDETLQGEYELNFDGSDLISGVYFYVLTAVTEDGLRIREGKKMLLIK